MSKTIEEAAKQFTDELFAGDDLTDFDTQTEKNDAYVMCMTFGNHLMSLPLSQRLTDEEKERVRKLYIDANDKLKICLNAMNHNQISELDNEYKKGINMGLILALKHIFGKELFREGEV